MSEINLGQFIKNVFDYSTGKPVQRQPNNVANENFQKAQNEAMKVVQQTAQNIVQNFVNRQDILNTQMILKDLTIYERSSLIKNLFDFPENISQMLENFLADGKTLSQKDLMLLMSKELDVSKLMQLMQTNGKNALEQIAKMITTMNQSGIFNTQKLKEMTVLVNACIPVSDASQAQVLKNFMIMYLPWLPLHESSCLNFEIQEENEPDNPKGEETVSFEISTKNYGLVKIFLYKDSCGYNMDVNCSELFPKDRFDEAVKNDKTFVLQEQPVFMVRKNSKDVFSKKQANVSFSKSVKLSGQLMIIVHSVIKIVMELDSSAALVGKRKTELE